jgi:hypothetical protein
MRIYTKVIVVALVLLFIVSMGAIGVTAAAKPSTTGALITENAGTPATDGKFYTQPDHGRP